MPVFGSQVVSQFQEFWHTYGMQSGPPPRGRPCSVCKHPQEREIATALLAGGSCRQVAKRYEIPVSTLARHHRLHLRARIARAEVAIGQSARVPCEPGSIEGQVVAEQRWRRIENFEEALDVMREMRHLYGRTLSLLEQAEASGDSSTALRAIREARCNLELLGRLDGSLGGPATPVPTKIEIVYAEKQLLPGDVRLLGEAN
jgi:hypothetical protein